ncbi:hypothetical protein RHO13_01615 [Orbus wheelerorum]|uniref:hypothetical protein n=1 Tax=Orbus wheelerorum TaxID=3074111 RepID=UPI00370D164E
MRLTQEKKMLKSIIKVINYSGDKNFNSIPFKIKLLVAMLLACVLVGWFYLFNRDAIMYFIEIGYSFDSTIGSLLPYSIKAFFPPFLIGCLFGIILIYLHSRYCVWYELKKYIDKEKVLRRILELENEISILRKTK